MKFFPILREVVIGNKRKKERKMEEYEKEEYLANEQDQLTNWADNERKETKIVLSDNRVTIQLENQAWAENDEYEKARQKYFQDWKDTPFNEG